MKRFHIDNIWIYILLFVVIFWLGFYLFNWVSPNLSMVAYMASLFILMLIFKHINKETRDEN